MNNNEYMRGLQRSNSLNYNYLQNQNNEILSMIRTHKEKLEELKDKEEIFNNDVYLNHNNSLDKIKNEKKNFIINDEIDVEDSIRLAKKFLNNNKEKTLTIFNSIDSKINSGNNSHISKYDSYFNNEKNKKVENYKLYNKTNYNYGTHKDFFIKNLESEYPEIKLETLIKQEHLNKMKNDKNELINHKKYYQYIDGYNNSYSHNISDIYNDKSLNKDNIVINSNIIFLQKKLEHAESRITILESNNNYLNKENHDLKEYIKELQQKHNQKEIDRNINNFGSYYTSNENSLLSNEVKNSIDKIMYSINYFIKKMLRIFPNLENEKKFEDLNWNEYNCLQQYLNSIEDKINELYIQNIKNINYSINDYNISGISNTVGNHRKKEKISKMNKIIRKLENKSAKKLKTRKIIENDIYNNYKSSNNNYSFNYKRQRLKIIIMLNIKTRLIGLNNE